jgi:PAS domain S-box-containing protein
VTFSFWMLLLIFLGAGIWGLRRFHNQARSVQRLKVSLEKTNRRLHAAEEEYQKAYEKWENDQSKLRNYLQLMDTLFNTIPNPIYFKDEDGVYHGCNRVFSKRILGLTRDRIIGRRPQELSEQIPADLAAVYQREEARMIEKAGPHAFEAPVQQADGLRRDYLFSLAPVTDDEGKFYGSVAVLYDLTEKNRATRDRLEKEKLESVLETAGGVCHELNQPLQAASGYAEIMAAHLTDTKAAGYVEKLTDQLDRMRDITDKLQGITRVEVTEYAGDTRIIDIHKSSEKSNDAERRTKAKDVEQKT